METRRSFIRTAGITTIGTILFTDPFLKSCSRASERSIEEIAGQFSYWCEIIRPLDFIFLRYYFVNLSPSGNKLKKINNKEDAYIIVRIPQQHIGEEVHKSTEPLVAGSDWSFDKADCSIKFPGENKKNYSRSFLSGYSYLSFKTKKKQQTIEFSDKSLTNWNQFDLLVMEDLKNYPGDIPINLLIEEEQYPISENNFPGSLAVAEINGLHIPVTLIEAPYKMILAPVVPFLRPERNTQYRYQFSSNDLNTYYQSKNKAKTLTALWSNNFFLEGVNLGKGISRIPPNFKIVAYEENSSITDSDAGTFLLPNPSAGEDPKYTFLVQNQRSKLAKLTNIQDYNRDVVSDYFSISSLGVSTFLHYKNMDAAGKDIVKWNQDIKLGRDNFVEITRLAIDARTGLKLLVSNISERRIEKGKSVLIYRQKFEYLEITKEFTDPLLFNNHLIKKITALSKGSYFLENPAGTGVSAMDECKQTFTGMPSLIKMPYECIDIKGNRHRWEIDVFIISKDAFDKPEEVKNTLVAFNKKILGFYNDTYSYDHSIKIKNERVAYTTELENDSADISNQATNTEMVTEEIQLYTIYNGSYESEHPLLPRLKYAMVFIPQLNGIDQDPKAYPVNFCKSYFKYGLSELNKTKVFLQVLSEDAVKKFEVSAKTDLEILEQFKKDCLQPITNIFSENYKNTGSLINPDIVIDNISVLKQGVTLTDELNDRVQEIQNINPADLLRGLNVEILGGISLKKILKNIIPIVDSPIFSVVEEATEAFKIYKEEYESLKSQVEQLPGQIVMMEKQIRGVFNSETKSYLDKYHQITDKINQFDLLNTVDLTIAKEKKKIYQALRENEKRLEDELVTKVRNSPLFINTIEPLEQFWNAAKEDIKVLIAAKQITDIIQERIEEVKIKIRDNANVEKYAQMLKDLGSALSDVRLFLLTNAMVLNAAKKVQDRWDDVLGADAKTLFEQYPGIAHTLLKDTFKQFLHSVTTGLSNPDTTVNIGGLHKIVTDCLASFENNELVLLANNSYQLHDNIEGFMEMLNSNKSQLEAKGSHYLTCIMDAANDTLSTSKDYIRSQQKKLENELYLLATQVKYEVKNELDNISQEVINKADAFRKIKEIYYFIQTTYLEFFELKRRAEDYALQLKISLPQFKQDFIDTVLPAVEKEIKKVLAVELDKLAKDPQLVEAAGEIRDLKTKVESLAFEKVAEYLDRFKTLEKEIRRQADVLYDRFDGERNKIIKAIEEKKQLLRSYEEKLKNFLQSKLREIETELRNSNQELITAYEKGAAAVTEAKAKIKSWQDALNNLRAINKKEIAYTWSTDKFDDVDLGLLKFYKGKQSPTTLAVDVKSTIHFNIQSFPPQIIDVTTITKNKLSNFSISFLSILNVEFDNVSFEAGSGIKEKFDVAIRDVRFQGPLNFVQVFQQYLQTIDKGLRLDVSAAGASLGYEVCLPDITGGAFNFVNWKLVMDLHLPFKAGVPMRIYIGLNTQQEMGLVTGAIWGGRGCLIIGLEPKRGVVYILLIIEVGVVLFLNIGVASGIVYIFAGIYIKKEYDRVELKGYLTCGGALDILGLITATVTFYMGLQSNGNYVDGFCTVSYEIEICAFLSISVSMSMYKRIAGSADNSQRSDAPSQPALNGNMQLFGADAYTITSVKRDLSKNTSAISDNEWDDYFSAYYN